MGKERDRRTVGVKSNVETEVSPQNLGKVGDICQKGNESTSNSQINEETEINRANDYKRNSQKDLNRKQRRLMQNRRSASRLRIKNKETFNSLLQDKLELEEENTSLKEKVYESQQVLMDALQETIQIRKKIDEVQKKQNKMLIEYFNEYHQNGIFGSEFFQQLDKNSLNLNNIEERTSTPIQAHQPGYDQSGLGSNSELKNMITSESSRNPWVPFSGSSLMKNQESNYRIMQNSIDKLHSNQIQPLQNLNYLSTALNALVKENPKKEKASFVGPKN
ncbi:unnamed protein product [Moneuplotes crassus]|uniref:BZIP domain-containing protein n=1 Tax=Euplotes crassus TaxID=5936 RepID=A0AAD1U9R4_EUPCR|nr:unnamed protein product [Moneuplotes crassus]